MLGAKSGKSYVLALVLVLISLATIFVVRAINGNTVDTSKPWHPLQQIAKDETSFESVDANANGIIDEAENANYAERAGTCDSCGAGGGAGVKSGDVVAGYLLLVYYHVDRSYTGAYPSSTGSYPPVMNLGSSKEAWLEMIMLDDQPYERYSRNWLLHWAPIYLRGDTWEDFVIMPCYFPEAGTYKIVVRLGNDDQNRFYIDDQYKEWDTRDPSASGVTVLNTFTPGGTVYEFSWNIATPGLKTCKVQMELDSVYATFYGFFIYKA